jgi:hypothetical protein
MPKTSGIELFGDEVNANALAEVLRWRGEPELGQITSALHAHTERKAFLDTWAEAMVARHLLSHHCNLRFEIPTPAGRRADFEVRRDGLKFFLHVKQIDTGRSNMRRMRISSRLRSLERIRRPYVVQVQWSEDATADQMQRLVTLAGEFILRAHVGDEMRARDENDHEFGGVRIIAPVPGSGSHVHLTIGLPTGFIDASPRIHRLMQRAHQQFMPRSMNVILICSGHADDEEDVQTALLGSHIERWDAFPPRGKRIAHGRDADGFWAGQTHSNSKLASWFCFGPRDSVVVRDLWVRKGAEIDAAVLNLAAEVFGSESR